MALNPTIDDWRGRVVWLVGASSGIGAATAEALHRRGARVAASARGAAELAALQQRLPGLVVLPLDVTDAAALREAAETLAGQFGRIDLAVYCAAHYRPMRATDFRLADALRHQDVNYSGALRWLDAVLPQLLKQSRNGDGRASGHLSLMASVAGYRGLPQALAYGPTKAALIHLAETLHLDLSGMGIGVSVVNPGFVRTPLTAGNAFRMPALLTPQEAAEAMVRGWEQGQFEIHFPRRFTLALKAMRPLPDWIYLRAARRWVGG